MSKVFKRTSSFVPEKILSQKEKDRPGWKSVTIPVSQEEDASAAETVYDRIHRRHLPDDFSGTDGDERPVSPHRTDFSAPDAFPQAYGEPESSTLGIEPFDHEKVQAEAYNQGIRDGLKRAEEDFGSSTKSLILACEQINTLRETILNNSMVEMQNLVLKIAEKIIRHSVTEQDRTIIDTVEDAIRQAVKSDEFLILVNPDDLDIIKSKSKEFIGSLSGLENIVVQASPAIDRGGCRIDSSTSTVDATIASQLQIIENKIKGKI